MQSVQSQHHTVRNLFSLTDSERQEMQKLIIFIIIGILIAGIISPAVAQPTTGSTTLNYLSPAPSAINISPKTSIAVRQGMRLEPSSIQSEIFVVEGSQSGIHTGKVNLSDDERTLLFFPDSPFAFDELITVRVQSGLKTITGELISGTQYQFFTLEKPMQSIPTMEMPSAYLTKNPSIPSADPFYYTYPEFTSLMTVTASTPGENSAEGLIFVTQTGIGNSDPYLYILDDNAEPIYIKSVQDEIPLHAFDFKVQTIESVPYLTYHAGIPVSVWSNGRYYVMDQSYTVIDSWTIGNGYGADEHELQLLENGNALLLSYIPIPVDLSPYGGPEDGTVIDILIQEQDPSKNVIFEWHGSQHIPLADSYNSLSNSPVDYMHTNAIEVDQDGNLLISSRNIDEITKISRETGEIIWRLGGKQNQFTFTNDNGFSAQHDIRRLINGNITLFDNGNRNTPQASRAVEYQINENAREVTRVWQYPDPIDESLYAPFMGNIQRLDNGHSMIGWGAIPKISEVQPDGTKTLEFELSGLTYRAFRYEWEGYPTETPRAFLVNVDNQSPATLYFSWNGATQVDSYQVFAGAIPHAMHLIATVPRTGFESSYTFANLDASRCVFKVRPVHAAGLTTPFSDIVYRPGTSECAADLPYVLYIPDVISQTSATLPSAP